MKNEHKKTIYSVLLLLLIMTLLFSGAVSIAIRGTKQIEQLEIDKDILTAQATNLVAEQKDLEKEVNSCYNQVRELNTNLSVSERRIADAEQVILDLSKLLVDNYEEIYYLDYWGVKKASDSIHAYTQKHIRD